MGSVREIRPGRRKPTAGARLGLIAHDANKESFARFMRAHRALAGSFRLVAPEDTARAIADLSLGVEVLAPDTMGGDLQLAAAVVAGHVDAVIFLHDPLASLPSEPAIATMLKVCDLELIPLATNLASAEIILHHLARRIGADPSIPRAVMPGEGPEGRVPVLVGPWAGEDDRRR